MHSYFVALVSPMLEDGQYGQKVSPVRVGHKRAGSCGGQQRTVSALFSEARGSWSRHQTALARYIAFPCCLWLDRAGRGPHLFPSKCQDAQIERGGGRCARVRARERVR